jgi:predicted ATPase
MISSLHLHNFKCFGDQDFPLKPLTLLTGLNSTGKSSVLQSLLLLRQSNQRGPLAAMGLMLRGDLVNIGVGNDVYFEGAEDEEIGIDMSIARPNGVEHITDIAQWRFKWERDSTADVLELIGSSSTDHELVYNSSLFDDNFHYLSAERVGPRESFPASDFQVSKHRQLGSKGEYTAHFLDVFRRSDISHERLGHKDAESLELQDQVEAWLGEISPGTHISPTSHSNMDIVELRYSSVFPELASKDRRSTNVGFGLTYVLPILVAVLSSAPGSLLLIENPEAHLHPKGQAQMGELLARAASCGIQIIVETHSDHVLNGIRVAVYERRLDCKDVQIHYFQRDEQDGQVQVISPRMGRNGRIDQWPNGFFDQWDISLEALLEPREM